MSQRVTWGVETILCPTGLGCDSVCRPCLYPTGHDSVCRHCLYPTGRDSVCRHCLCPTGREPLQTLQGPDPNRRDHPGSERNGHPLCSGARAFRHASILLAGWIISLSVCLHVCLFIRQSVSVHIYIYLSLRHFALQQPTCCLYRWVTLHPNTLKWKLEFVLTSTYTTHPHPNTLTSTPR